MRKLFLPAVACTLWLMFTGSAAAAITYTLNVPVGAGSVTGTITTDGFIGSLFTVDITSFSLQLNDPSSPPPAVLDSSTGGLIFIGSGSLVATPDTLTFDFASGGFVNFFQGPGTTCFPVWTLRAPGSGGTSCNGLAATSNFGIDALQVSSTASVIGDVSVPSSTVLDLTPGPVATPEPASLAMIVAGLVSMIGLRKLRF